MMKKQSIFLLYTCDAWHSWASMHLVAPFSSRRMINRYLDILRKNKELTDEDLENIERYNQTQGNRTNYYVSEEDVNPDYKNDDGSITPLIHWLKTIKCPLCKSKKVRKDFDFPSTMRCCESCGCDFNTSGEIILNPNDLK